jgi:uncharacterized protein (DUF2236 family)
MNPVARKINREGIVLLGWGRAILLQVAHPLIAAAISDFSDFDQGAAGYLRRMHRTVGAMLTLTFGTEDEARAVLARINRIHDQVEGTLAEPAGTFAAGTRYSARDPELLLWVHATLVDSLMLTFERLVGPLTAAERDAFCAEAVSTAVALGVPADIVPATSADLQRYVDGMLRSGVLTVTPRARAIADALFAPPIGPASLPFGAVSRLLTVGMLPDTIRRGYGFGWSARRARWSQALLGVMRRTRRVLPPMLREWRGARVA